MHSKHIETIAPSIRISVTTEEDAKAFGYEDLEQFQAATDQSITAKQVQRSMVNLSRGFAKSKEAKMDVLYRKMVDTVWNENFGSISNSVLTESKDTNKAFIDALEATDPSEIADAVRDAVFDRLTNLKMLATNEVTGKAGCVALTYAKAYLSYAEKKSTLDAAMLYQGQNAL